MITFLFDQLKGVLGRTYVMAGLIPSAILLLGYYWTRQIDGSLGELLKKALEAIWTEKAQDLSIDTLLLIITVLSMGLVFYACRGFFLYFLQNLPWTWVIREWACNLQRKCLRHSQKEKNEHTWRLSAVLWYQRDYDANIPNPPSWLTPPRAETALRSSLKARNILKTFLHNYNDIDRDQQDLITEGLVSLRNWVACKPEEANNWRPELKEWEVLSGTQSDKMAKNLSDAQGKVQDKLNKVGLDIRRQADQAYFRVLAFPHELWVKPTKLGNRLAVLDDYSYDRYGVHTSALWTRLRYDLDADKRKEIADAQLGVEVFANISIALGLLFLYTFFKVFSSLFYNAPGYIPHYSPFAIGFAVFGWIAYQGAVFAFDLQSNKMIGLIDLYRRKVLTSMGFPTPNNLKEERELFSMLRGFFTQASKPSALLDKTTDGAEQRRIILP